jgi:hypothetical protein
MGFFDAVVLWQDQTEIETDHSLVGFWIVHDCSNQEGYVICHILVVFWIDHDDSNPAEIAQEYKVVFCRMAVVIWIYHDDIRNPFCRKVEVTFCGKLVHGGNHHWLLHDNA